MEAEMCMTYKIKQVCFFFCCVCMKLNLIVCRKKNEGRKVFNNILAFCGTLTRNSLE